HPNGWYSGARLGESRARTPRYHRRGYLSATLIFDFSGWLAGCWAIAGAGLSGDDTGLCGNLRAVAQRFRHSWLAPAADGIRWRRLPTGWPVDAGDRRHRGTRRGVDG